MSGYTPIFSSVFDGTLHGKWPHTGVWVCLLAMADRHGCIDLIPRKIASNIGIDEDQLLRCIADFCSPDEYSRTADNDGRRLELIEPGRPWGWRILNHGKYREKARKAAFDSQRAADGRNAERMRTRDDPRSPAMTRDDPPSDSNSNSNTNSERLRSSSGKSLRPSSSERRDSDGLKNRESQKAAVRRLAESALQAIPRDRE